MWYNHAIPISMHVFISCQVFKAIQKNLAFSSTEMKTQLTSNNCQSLKEGCSPVWDLNKIKKKKSMILPNSSWEVQ